MFNTLTWAVAHVDEETKTLLDENPSKIPDTILKELLENGFVVEDSCDERKKLAYYFDRDKYNVIPDTLGYVVAVTYACNLRCPYCYEGTVKDIKTLNNKKLDILLKNIDKTLSKKDFNVLQIGLYGGEPLLAYDKCVRLMEGVSRLCDEHGTELQGSIVTNGVLITEEVIDTLLNPYCYRIQLTMDGGREAHNTRRIRKDGSGTYDIILNTIKLLSHTDIYVDIRLNIDRENADTFIELFKDLKKEGLGNISKSLGWIHPPDAERLGDGCPGYAEKCFSHQEMAEFEDRIINQMKEMGISYEMPEISKHIPCTYDREDMWLVDPYLNLYKCWEFLGQKDKKVGYINENGEIVFHYEYYEQMSRNPFEFEDCRDCTYLPLCAGGCAAQAYLEKGTYHSSCCGREKYSIQKYINKYMKRYLDQYAELSHD